MRHFPHSAYYRDRDSEYDLCNDFPGDEILIDGLHSMQSHFWDNNIAVDIPIVRVMNTAHFLAAYMFANECSGDRMEYDALAHDSIGRNKSLVYVTLIVLAAMLQRTNSFRARQCRNIILDNRDADFEEGVTLYERFLRSADKNFAEEDFLIDVHLLVAKVREQDEQIAQLSSENIKLKYTITTMEEKYQQINIGTQNNNCTVNNYYTTTTTTTANDSTEPASSSEQPQMDLFKYIHPSVTDVEERRRIHLEIQNLVRTLPLVEICRYLRQMYKEKRIYLNVKTDAMFEELHRMGMPDESTQGFSQKNFQNYFNIND